MVFVLGLSRVKGRKRTEGGGGGGEEKGTLSTGQ